MGHKSITATLLTGIAIAALGCAKPPADAVTAADTKLTEARSAEAAVYAPQTIAAAEEARRKLDAELTVQQDKFAMMRSYDEAEKLALEVQNTAAAAATEARAEKERQRVEATEMLAAARESLASVSDMLAKAPKSKGTKADLAALASDLTAVEQAVSGADEALAAERYADVRATLQAANQSMDAVRTSIETAMATKGSR